MLKKHTFLLLSAVIVIIGASLFAFTASGKLTNKTTIETNSIESATEGDTSPDNGKYKKAGFDELSFLINGENIVFHYDYSQKITRPAETVLAGREADYVLDIYVSKEGYTVATYEGSSYLKSFTTRTYGEVPKTVESSAEAINIATMIIDKSDIGIPNILASSDTTVTDDGINRYRVKFKNEHGVAEICIDYSGELRSINTIHDASTYVSESTKAELRESVNQKIAEIESANPKAKCEITDEQFVFYGNDIQAEYMVSYCEEGAYTAFQFYCFV